jgi:hypothetical protein
VPLSRHLRRQFKGWFSNKGFLNPTGVRWQHLTHAVFVLTARPIEILGRAGGTTSTRVTTHQVKKGWCKSSVGSLLDPTTKEIC